MSKTGAFAMLALVNGFVFLSVACAPEIPPAPGKSNSDLTGPKKSPPAGSSSTPAPAGSAPTGTNGAATGDDDDDGGEETEDPNEAANQAKFLQCVSQNTTARALAEQRTACFNACEDDACEAKCEPCTGDEATCNIIFQCEEEAFPDTGEGGEGEEGEGNED
jgi:hypothetical protein